MDMEKYRRGERFPDHLSIAIDSEMNARIEALKGQGIKVSAWIRDLIAEKLPTLEQEAKRG